VWTFFFFHEDQSSSGFGVNSTQPLHNSSEFVYALFTQYCDEVDPSVKNAFMSPVAVILGAVLSPVFLEFKEFAIELAQTCSDKFRRPEVYDFSGSGDDLEIEWELNQAGLAVVKSTGGVSDDVVGHLGGGLQSGMILKSVDGRKLDRVSVSLLSYVNGLKAPCKLGFVKQRKSKVAAVTRTKRSSSVIENADVSHRNKEGANVLKLHAEIRVLKSKILFFDVQKEMQVKAKADGLERQTNMAFTILHLFVTICGLCLYLNHISVVTKGDHFMCLAVRGLVAPLHKSLSISLWAALLTVLSYIQWEKTRKITPKQLVQTGKMQAGSRPVDRNRLMDVILVFTLVPFCCWCCCAVAVIPALAGLAPIVLTALLTIPLVFMVFPLHLISLARCRLGLKEVDLKSMIREKPDLMVKVGMALVFNCTIIFAWFAQLYFGDMKIPIKTLIVSALNYLSKVAFSLHLTFSWPSKIPLPSQINLALSLGVTGSQSLIFLVKLMNLSDVTGELPTAKKLLFQFVSGLGMSTLGPTFHIVNQKKKLTSNKSTNTINSSEKPVVNPLNTSSLSNPLLHSELETDESGLIVLESSQKLSWLGLQPLSVSVHGGPTDDFANLGADNFAKIVSEYGYNNPGMQNIIVSECGYNNNP
jgi:hypothetical protein